MLLISSYRTSSIMNGKKSKWPIYCHFMSIIDLVAAVMTSSSIIAAGYCRVCSCFIKWEGKAGRGDDPGQLKKFRQGGHMGGFNKYIYLKGLFFI